MTRLDSRLILKQSAQKLKDLISSKSSSFGATSTGADWCVKALHPSDPMTEVRGVPDQSAVPSLFMNYQTVTTISPSNGASGTWAVDMQLLPHPVGFASYSKTDSVGTVVSEVLNAQLSGTDHGPKFDSFRNSFKRWRLAYASVTIYQDGPDLANQGTVVACQKPVEPAMWSPTVGNLNGIYTGMMGYFHAFNLNASDLPDYTASQAMPNAYFGRSREGLYMPLKLTHTHQVWHSIADSVYQATSASVNEDVTNPSFLQLGLPFSGSAIATGSYPFTTLNQLHYYQTGNDAGNLAGTPTSPFCNSNWGDISFRNMAVTTSLSLFFRFGFECQVTPDSILAPHLKLSPPYDPAAVSAYFSIARELKDAYPADFNDLGKIWGAIKDAASVLAPVVELIPGIGNTVVTAGKIAGRIGDKIVGAVQRSAEPTIGNTASEADRERVRQLVKQVTSPVPAPPPMPPQIVISGATGLRRKFRSRNMTLQEAVAAPNLRRRKRFEIVRPK